MLTIAFVTAACALLVKLLKAAEPLWTRIPEAWRWVPPVLLAVCMSCAAAGATGGATWQDLATATMTGIVAGLAAIGGREATLRAAGKRDWMPAQGEPKADDDLPENPYKDVPPGSSGLLVLFLVLASWSLTACAGSFELARGQGSLDRGVVRTQVTYKATPGAPAQATIDKQRCEELDDQHRLWSSLAQGGGVVTGVGGISTIPVDDQNTRIAIAAGAVAAAAFTAFAVSMSDSSSTAWARECSAP